MNTSVFTPEINLSAVSRLSFAAALLGAFLLNLAFDFSLIILIMWLLVSYLPFFLLFIIYHNLTYQMLDDRMRAYRRKAVLWELLYSDITKVDELKGGLVIYPKGSSYSWRYSLPVGSATKDMIGELRLHGVEC